MNGLTFNEYDEEEDVVIEGSDLHQALIDAGLSDFVCTPVKRTEFIDIEDTNENSKLLVFKYDKWFPNFLTNIVDVSWLYRKNESKLPEIKQLNIILQLESLLSDHVEEIHHFHNQTSSLNGYNKKPSRIPSLIIISGSMLVIACYKYLDLRSIKSLKNFVSTQNNLYYLYKKILRILKNGYCIKLSSNSLQRKFSELEVERLKYLQPMCETFIQSLEQISYLYYQKSLCLINLYSDLKLNHLITKFDVHHFKLQGEITYERLKKFYYMYILVQSELMLLLATIYKHNSENTNFFLHRKLSQVIDHLSKMLKRYSLKLHVIVEDYKNTKIGRLSLESQKKPHIRWQDFYAHSDLLARKIQSAYNNVCSVIDEIDNWNDSEETDEFFNKLTKKMETIYKEIDTARNFAEFNILLINKYRNPRQLTYSELNKKSAINDNENELLVVYDEDPFIVDEVFEEYIKEEYFKPLYEDHNPESLEKIKLDKLLAKNFMSELKEVLIDKYLSMSEREAKALLRFKDKYLVGKNNDNEVPVEPQRIPEPPPLPKTRDDLGFNENQDICEPLLGLKKFQTCSDSDVMNEISKSNDTKKCILNEKLFSEQQETERRPPIGINLRDIQLPAFIVMEETFTGSGENSDEELIQSDNQNVNND
ncbi:uncharacterized protein [Chelonus insularis]|uniref:uncharacterized protein n=1 Tax=Chelonus insularis TaxID=460826 RepID=UPI00158DEA2F|nr:uncharacterized protein LOC118065507 [Chelonus insularis]